MGYGCKQRISTVLSRRFYRESIATVPTRRPRDWMGPWWWNAMGRSLLLFSRSNLRKPGLELEQLSKFSLLYHSAQEAYEEDQVSNRSYVQRLQSYLSEKMQIDVEDTNVHCVGLSCVLFRTRSPPVLICAHRQVVTYFLALIKPQSKSRSFAFPHGRNI